MLRKRYENLVLLLMEDEKQEVGMLINGIDL